MSASAMKRFAPVMSLFVGLAISTAAADTINWSASSGLMPHQIATPWNLVTNAGLSPSLSSGNQYMSLATGTTTTNTLYYIREGAAFDTSQDFKIEARLRRSGTETVNTGNFFAPARRSAIISWNIASVTPGQQRQGTILFDIDRVFMIASETSAPSYTIGQSAIVDTNDAFHTFRIEVDNQTANASVYYDNAFLFAQTGYLSASTSQPNLNRLYWGDSTSIASGTTDWATFNLSAVPEPLTAGAVALLCLRVGARRQRMG